MMETQWNWGYPIDSTISGLLPTNFTKICWSPGRDFTMISGWTRVSYEEFMENTADCYDYDLAEN